MCLGKSLSHLRLLASLIWKRDVEPSCSLTLIGARCERLGKFVLHVATQWVQQATYGLLLQLEMYCCDNFL